jgi:HPt (histidine-containing phosphotransfer) domain-containing protein
MSFLIQRACAELMLDPAELKEILQAYFEDAPQMLAQGQQAADSQDWVRLAKSMHALKGASYNLRLERLGELANMAEQGKSLPTAKLREVLQAIQMEMQRAETEIADYFARRT